MQIDENTKIIAKLHKTVSPRGLNIYNPFFEESKLNAIYMLFQNEDPKKLLEGMRDLNFFGAMCAVYENDPALPTLLDEIDSVSKFVKRVGYIKNVNGKFIGYCQWGDGMFRLISSYKKLDDSDISIVGSGNITKSLLFHLQEHNISAKSITVYNRTVEKAENMARELSFPIEVKPLNELNNASGDLLLNNTNIGGSDEDAIYTENIISKFDTILDVTFEHDEDTNLISTAKRMNKSIITGREFFAYQGLVILENLFDKKLDIEILKKHVVNGLSQTAK